MFRLVALFVFFPSLLFAQTDVFVRGSQDRYPIALPQLCLQDGVTDGNKLVPERISRNLVSSRYFEVINPNAYIETPGKCSSTPSAFAYSDWSVIGADFLVKGVISEDDDNIRLQLYLFDVPKQKLTFGKEYTGGSGQLRLMADKFSNEILRIFTGTPGVFGSKIVFTSRVGRFKELFAMDVDGSEVRQLTDERGLTIAPAFHPSGDRLLYTSYQLRVPELFIYDFGRRQSRAITSGKELEIGGSFAPDGNSLVTAVSLGKESNLVLMRLDGTPVKKLTSQPGVIDVSPKWSPAGNEIVFTSNRAGGPQIYVMDTASLRARRVSFANSNYCTSPDWSPKGDRIVFVCRSDGGFNIFTARPDGTDPLQLTSSGNNEDPEWSPNGEELVFATTYGKTGAYNIGVMRADGSGFRLITESRTDDADPTWGPVPVG
ncbi:MAG: PD40 domain-containing protein [Bdellovibrionales bacterium]|nr:PD40 domain-containing protein [Bdellovibrionales bacterium]